MTTARRDGMRATSLTEESMNTKLQQRRLIVGALGITGVLVLAHGCTSMSGAMGGGAETLTLSGSNEVPAVNTSATGSAVVTIKPDKSVTVKVTVTGMTATASHIH